MSKLFLLLLLCVCVQGKSMEVRQHLKPILFFNLWVLQIYSGPHDRYQMSLVAVNFYFPSVLSSKMSSRLRSGGSVNVFLGLNT